MPSVADLIVSRLRDAGVAALFGVPGGGSNLEVIDAARRAGIPFVLTATETGGAIAAIAQAEITGAPGACLTTIGPGVASVVNGIACARLDRAPLIVLTDSYPAAGGDLFAHQRLDHHALLAPVTKWSAALAPDNVGDVLDVLDGAIACAMAPPQGPVQIECAPDVAAMTPPPSAMKKSEHAVAEPQFLIVGPWETARAEIARARKPLVIAGIGARRPADVAAVRSLCERHWLPAMVTYKAKGVVPDTSPHFAGVFTNAAIEQTILDEADLVIGIGFDPVELLPRPWRLGTTTRTPQPVVYCGPWPVEARHVPFVAQLVGDVAAGIKQIDEALVESDWNLEAVSGTVAAQKGAAFAPSSPLSAHQVVQHAAIAAASMAVTPAASMAAVQKKPRVSVDAGAHMLPATMLWPVSEPNEMLISNGLSTMGFALPAAIGAALLERDRPVVALTGDGGLLMCAGELLTAVREQLHIVTIVFNDRSLSLIDVKQRQKQYASTGVTLGDVAWSSVAEGFGMRAHVAATDSELERALAAALAHPGPSLIDARIDPASYADTLRVIRG